MENGTLSWKAMSNLIADSWSELFIIKAKGKLFFSFQEIQWIFLSDYYLLLQFNLTKKNMHCRKICKHRYYEKQIIVELKIYIFLVSSTYLSFLSIFFIKGRFFIFLISIRGFCSMYIYLFKAFKNL